MENLSYFLSVVASVLGIAGFVWSWMNHVKIKKINNFGNYFSNIHSSRNGRDGIHIGDDRNE
ncbi:MAG: hypothetical protein ACOZAR_03825 [Patescibacteria group bacterium]